ncbi:hypothetical protein [Myxococcus sp. Y35]|uniref:hypothetical protein n=1 Tax=Pseudomyxococcus flavus TaxID=3115648 RepID=UPI003CEA08E5
MNTLTDVALLEAYLAAAKDPAQEATAQKLADEIKARGPERAAEARKVVGEKREAARQVAQEEVPLAGPGTPLDFINFAALAAALCHPRAGRIVYQSSVPQWDAIQRRHVDGPAEAHAWVSGPWDCLKSLTVAELVEVVFERLGRPSFPEESAALEREWADVALVLSRQDDGLQMERWGGERPASHLPVRWRVLARGYWCNGNTPAEAFRCAGMVLRGELVGTRGEAELPEDGVHQ